MRFLNAAEINFFRTQYDSDKRNGLGDRLPMDRRRELTKKYREQFPEFERTDASICTQWYCAKRNIYAFNEKSSRVQRQPAQEKINFSRANGCELDNIIIDLIDCVSAIKEENEKLRKFRDAIVAVKV